MGYYKRIRDLREDHDLTQRQLAALLLCLGLPLFTGLLACAPWVLPGLVLGVSLPLLLAFFLCTPPGGLG